MRRHPLLRKPRLYVLVATWEQASTQLYQSPTPPTNRSSHRLLNLPCLHLHLHRQPVKVHLHRQAAHRQTGRPRDGIFLRTLAFALVSTASRSRKHHAVCR